ncbi:GNAT family N-acetyltransferase [Paenibacillus odorifer]|jgi:RimJ/RimL family protein N-acetyltransferase|uniref:GNAT family N-acetyltransferase n=1 Tax=Paenibacillus odorifer TaxID=189426 RepID=UPI00211714D7|nr:GNAT family protein [Paenibacillus odorifer]
MFTIENLNGEYVGGVNLNSIDEKNGTFSIGVQVDRDHRGKGYGTRAINILLKYAFLELRLKQI